MDDWTPEPLETTDTTESSEIKDVRKPASPARKKRKVKKPISKLSLIFLVFWIVIIGLSFMLITGQIAEYNALRTEVEQLYSQKAQVRAYNDELELQIEFFDSDLYIERQARNRLRMVRPDEIFFRNTAVD